MKTDAPWWYPAVAASLMVVAVNGVQAPNDKQQIEPMLTQIGALSSEPGKVDAVAPDTRYFSAANLAACNVAGIGPLIAMGRQPRHSLMGGRSVTDLDTPENPTSMGAKAYRLRTRERRDLNASREQILELVFGIIKSVMGFPRSLLRGIEMVRGEWSLVTMAWNVKQLFVLCPQG